MPRPARGVSWWLLPVVDLVSSSVALIAVVLLAGVAVFPALPIAPLLLVVVYGALGVYGSNPAQRLARRRGRHGAGR